MVQVTIKYQGSHGSNEEVDIEASDLVSAVKDKIANFSDGSRLVFEGRELDDDSRPMSFYKFVPATLYGTWLWVMGPSLKFDEAEMKFIIPEDHAAAAHLSKEQVATHNMGTSADPDGSVYAEVTGKPSPLIEQPAAEDADAADGSPEGDAGELDTTADQLDTTADQLNITADPLTPNDRRVTENGWPGLKSST